MSKYFKLTHISTGKPCIVALNRALYIGPVVDGKGTIIDFDIENKWCTVSETVEEIIDMFSLEINGETLPSGTLSKET